MSYQLLAEATANRFPCPWQLTMTSTAPFTVRVDVTLNGQDWVVFREGESVSNIVTWTLDLIAQKWRVLGKSATNNTPFQGVLKPIWKGT